MQIPNPLLLTLIGGVVVALPAVAATPEAPVECASNASLKIPVKVMATMSADAGSPEANWDYEFNPFPPCSFG